ncbi:MAG: putative DNA modification/repair radical SAM protein [Lachnospiraceae bacterium]|nr:putative DNA modification/repair radical SAM protein [Lachnospiraceae bacterium]
MRIQQDMSIQQKLKILTDAAKYDVACTSSGVNRSNDGRGMGSAEACGICHTFASDGRCVSLLKILFTNECIFDCKYCVNRCSNDVPRASFTPDEICTLTMEFYRRNYIEGLFLSSGIINNPNYTMGLIYEALWKLRNEHHFYGYIHVKGIPGTSPEIIEKIGFLADRMSVNLELPTAEGLRNLAPNKNRKNILTPMKQIQVGRKQLIATKDEGYQVPAKRGAFKSKFVPAGQSTQMIIGATPETDYQLMAVTEALYNNFKLKRVFYSAFVDVNHNIDLPAVTATSPMLREHRLYQADWLLRFYGFKAGELLDEQQPNFNVALDPKCDWAVRHLEFFPVEIMKADYYLLLRVPGLGVTSAKRIVSARRQRTLDFDALKRMGVVLKRAAYFITCNGKMMLPIKQDRDYITRNLVDAERLGLSKIQGDMTYEQLSFDLGSMQ